MDKRKRKGIRGRIVVRKCPKCGTTMIGNSFIVTLKEFGERKSNEQST
jgi:uncharacterized OB-fold protein